MVFWAFSLTSLVALTPSNVQGTWNLSGYWNHVEGASDVFPGDVLGTAQIETDSIDLLTDRLSLTLDEFLFTDLGNGVYRGSAVGDDDGIFDSQQLTYTDIDLLEVAPSIFLMILVKTYYYSLDDYFQGSPRECEMIACLLTKENISLPSQVFWNGRYDAKSIWMNTSIGRGHDMSPAEIVEVGSSYEGILPRASTAGHFRADGNSTDNQDQLSLTSFSTVDDGFLNYVGGSSTAI